jgi:hypothetical protein
LELKVLQRGNAFLACFFASSITIGLGEYLFPAIGFVRRADDMAYFGAVGPPVAARTGATRESRSSDHEVACARIHIERIKLLIKKG